MKPEALPPFLFGTDIVLRYEKSIQIRFSEKRQVLSSSPLNGGYREDLSAVFNFDETPAKGKKCVMRASTYEQHMELIAEELGLNPTNCAGLSTAAHMKYAASVSRSYNGTSVTAIVTGGINKNGGRAGDPASWDEHAFNEENRRHGTVNIMLAVDSHLSQGAMAKAVITATEAKTAAIQELLAQSFYSDGLATGTGTDGIIVIANPQSDIYLTDAGQHSKLGELIGSTVLAAVKRALYLQTGLGYQQQHNVFSRMRRFGVTEQSITERFLESQPSPEEIKLFRLRMKEVASQDNLLTYTSLYAHLLDQLKWGMLLPKEAVFAANNLLCLMEMPCRLSDSSDDSYIQMIAQYRNRLFDKIMNAC